MRRGESSERFDDDLDGMVEKIVRKRYNSYGNLLWEEVDEGADGVVEERRELDFDCLLDAWMG